MAERRKRMAELMVESEKIVVFIWYKIDLFYFMSLFLFDFIVCINVIILQFMLRIYILRGDFLNCFCYAIFCVM